MSCIPSAAVLHLHHLHRKRRIGDVHSEKSLNFTIAFAVVKVVVSLIGEWRGAKHVLLVGVVGDKLIGINAFVCTAVIVYVSISIEENIPLLPIKTSLYLGAIQALMVTKWSVALAMYAKKYKMYVDGAYDEIWWYVIVQTKIVRVVYG